MSTVPTDGIKLSAVLPQRWNEESDPTGHLELGGHFSNPRAEYLRHSMNYHLPREGCNNINIDPVTSTVAMVHFIRPMLLSVLATVHGGRLATAVVEKC